MDIEHKIRPHEIVFGKKWFEKYQKHLVFLLNFKLTRKWFRKLLDIECGKKNISKDKSEHSKRAQEKVLQEMHELP